MNSLTKLLATLKSGANEIFVSADVIKRARIPIERLLDFAARRQQVIYGNSDA